MDKMLKEKEKMIVEFEDRKERDYGRKEKDVGYVKSTIQEIVIDPIKAKRQCRLEINGIEVYFPYTPYTNQLAYMQKVIEACNSGNLAALESPTGTGKTLCLLCASLGWLRAKRKELKEQASKMYSDEAEALAKEAPFIYYSSRTHSQLANVIKELKKTCYLPKTATLSSRDQMCVNSAVKSFSGNLLNIKCKQVRFRKECKYYFGAEKLSLGAYDNTDIEDLYSIGQKSGFCPFYFQRNKKDIADILFLPYNYIFESKFRKALKLELRNAIVLIDEAHNMENVCEHSKSFDLSTKMIDECLYDLNQVKKMLEGGDVILSKESALKGVEPKKIKDQESILTNIKGYLKSFSVRQGNGWPNFGLKLNPKEFFDIFFEGSKRNDKNQGQIFNDITKDDPDSRITPENIRTHLSLLKKVESAIVDEFQKTSIISSYTDILELISSLSENYLIFIKSGDQNPTNCFVNNYKIFLNDVEDTVPFNAKANNLNKNSTTTSNSKIRTLFLYCFNPGFGFKDVITSGATSVIITSGTLSPIESMETELKCNFKVKLENKHVIDKQQVNFTVLTHSLKTKTLFKFDAGNRSNTHMIEELGNTISDLCKVTPGGILVFFTAYTFMNSCIGTWAEKEILSEIEKSKDIFKDVSDSNKNKLVLKSFTEACQASTENVPSYRKPKKGGILFSVCRGTSSEGIDFSDDMARLVIIVGIPYPNLGDVKVNLKKEFLDEYNSKYFNYLDKGMNIKKLSSGDWYTQSATKAVNQALGRVIRHIDDYGTMILIDSRYKELLHKRVFSAWLRENVKIHEDTKVLLETKNFFDSMKNYISDKRQKRKENNKLSDEKNEINKINDNSNSIGSVAFKNPQLILPAGNQINHVNSGNQANNINNNNNFSNYSSESVTKFNSMNLNNNLNISGGKNGQGTISISNNPLSNNDGQALKRSNFTNQREKVQYNAEISDEEEDIYGKVMSKRGKKNENTNSHINPLSNLNIKENSISNIKSNSNNSNNFSCLSNKPEGNSSSTSNIIDEIKQQLNALNDINKDINLDMNKINRVTAGSTINININQNNNYMIKFNNTQSQGQSQSNNNNLKSNTNSITSNNNPILKSNPQPQKSFAPIIPCSNAKYSINFSNQSNNINQSNNFQQNNNIQNNDHFEENIFDSLNQDELMDIINQNISYFEDEEPNSLPADKKTPRISTSKKKVFRQGPMSSMISEFNSSNKEVSTSRNLNFANDLNLQLSQQTPLKTNSASNEEIKSDIIVKKLLELKERSQLDGLLEKYNLKLCFDSQTMNEPDAAIKKVEDKNQKQSEKRIECPICFETENKKFSAAKCGHILCKECWEKCLENKLECPMCKKKVRQSTLVNIFL